MSRIDSEHVENLKEGDWVIVIGLIDEPKEEPPERHPWEDPPIWPYSYRPSPPNYWRPHGVDKQEEITFAPNGIPYCILAISLPFIGVTDGRSHKGAIDVRRVQIRKAEPRYAEMMNRFTHDFEWTKDGQIVPLPEKEEFHTEGSPDTNTETIYCHRCGHQATSHAAPPGAPGNIVHVCDNPHCIACGSAIGFSNQPPSS